MEKKYNFNEEENNPNTLSEPSAEYGIRTEEVVEAFYDIPNEYLARRIENAEKDIAEGNVISLEEARRRILK